MSTPQDGTQATDEHMAASEEVHRGYLTGPGLVEFPVEYVVVDDIALYQGCIDMGPADQVAKEAKEAAERHLVLATTAYAGTEGARQGTAAEQQGVGLPSDSRFLWTGGRVAYTINDDVPDQQRVEDAIAHLEENTGIRFERRAASNAAQLPNWIQIVSNGSNSWSSSAIGMRGGRQLIRLADSHRWPILVHEFLHALGVYHEQSRSDRDEYVEVKWSNIQDGPPPEGEKNALGNFQKQPGSTDYFDYDYGSLMHYGRRSFAKDSSKPTLVPIQTGVTIGQRNEMSFGDRQTVAKMYERFATKGYAGVWRAGSGRYGLWANSPYSDFREKWQSWSQSGLRLVDLHVRQTRGGARFSGVFLPGSGAHGLWVNATWNSFKAKRDAWTRQGLRLHDLHIHRVNGQNRYSGVFLPGNGGHGLWINATWNSFKAKRDEWSQQGLRLHDLHVHNVNGQNRYSGVFLPGSGGHGLWINASWNSFVDKWQEWSGRGLRLVDLNVHKSGGENRYAGVFLPGNDAHYLWANVTYQSFRTKWQELAGQGLRLVDFEFVNPAVGSSLDADDAADAQPELLEVGTAPFGGLVDTAAPEVLELAGRVESVADEPAHAADAGDGLGGMELTGTTAYSASSADGEGMGGVHLEEVGESEADGAGEAHFGDVVSTAGGDGQSGMGDAVLDGGASGDERQSI